MKKLKSHLLLLFFILLIFFLPIAQLFKKSSSMSTLENRQLEQIPPFSLSSFFNGSYQSALENGLRDQLFLSYNFKTIYNKTNQTFNNRMANKFFVFKDKKPTFYLNNLIEYEGYFVINYIDILYTETNLNKKTDTYIKTKSNYHTLKKRAKQYNELTKKYKNIDFYTFYIETASDIDFLNNKITHKYKNTFLNI